MKQWKDRVVVSLIFCLFMNFISIYSGLDEDFCTSENPESLLVKQFNQCSLNKYDNFNYWKKACDVLPKYSDSEQRSSFETPLALDVLQQTLNNFFAIIERQCANGFWIGGKSNELLISKQRSYVQKIVVDPDSKIAIHGDIHGDIHSLNAFIQRLADEGYLEKDNPFNIIDPQFYIIFLGDYVDRGWYGVEVLYTLLSLKNRNPDRVFLIRGNHEDIRNNMIHGFDCEIRDKYKFEDMNYYRWIIMFMKLYRYLPLACYLGSGVPEHINLIQCCHGGLEIGVDPSLLVQSNNKQAYMEVSVLDQDAGFKKLKKFFPDIPEKEFEEYEKLFLKSYFDARDTYFLWGDFSVEQGSLFRPSQRGGDFCEFGKEIVEKFLACWSNEKNRLQAIFRGHQHEGLSSAIAQRFFNMDNQGHKDDAGLAKLWISDSAEHRENSGLLNGVKVVTFPVSPHTPYLYPYDVFGLLKTAKRYEDWRLKVCRIEK